MGHLSEWKANDGDEFQREYVGYVDVGNQWRIVVRTVSGYESHAYDADEKTWRFDAAPQYLRIKAVEKLPELIEALTATVDKTAERLRKKIAPAQELASAVSAPPVSNFLQTLQILGAAAPPPPKGTIPVTRRREKK